MDEIRKLAIKAKKSGQLAIVTGLSRTDLQPPKDVELIEFIKKSVGLKRTVPILLLPFDVTVSVYRYAGRERDVVLLSHVDTLNEYIRKGETEP